MIQYQEAISILTELAQSRKLDPEIISIEECIERISTQDVMAKEYIPPFHNSAMDGFAIHSNQTTHASSDHPVRFQVNQCIAAGDVGGDPISNPSFAVEIMTGAPMPEGVLDSVVKVEEVGLVKDSHGRVKEIIVRKPIAHQENVRERGEDFKPGQVVIRSGERLCAEHLLALTSLGITHLSVIRQPKVAVISTGKELVHYSEKPAEGKIRNSTAPYLMAALPQYGVKSFYCGNIPDEKRTFKSMLLRLFGEGVDLIITTGAVSMGKFDFIPEVLREVDAKIHFHKVAIRPGKPILFASWPHLKPNHNPVLFGVPGNPISTAVGLRFFVGPYLRALFGFNPEQSIDAEVVNDSKKPEGLRCFFKAKLKMRSDQLPAKPLVEILSHQASFMVSPLLKSNAWAVLSEEGALVQKGAFVKVFPLHPDLGETRT